MTPSPATWWMTSSCPCWRAPPSRPASRNERQEQQPVSLATFSPQELQRFTRTFEDLFYAADPVSMSSYYTEHAQLGPPLIRYLVIDMAGELQIELGVPVAAPVTASGRVQPGVLP